MIILGGRRIQEIAFIFSNCLKFYKESEADRSFPPLFEFKNISWSWQWCSKWRTNSNVSLKYIVVAKGHAHCTLHSNQAENEEWEAYIVRCLYALIVFAGPPFCVPNEQRIYAESEERAAYVCCAAVFAGPLFYDDLYSYAHHSERHKKGDLS